MRDDIFFNFGQKVPSAGFPLAHIHVPSSTIPPVIGLAEGYPYNIPGLLLRYDGVSGTVNVFGATLGVAVTEVIAYNKVANSSFFLLTGWSATGFTHSNTLGRTGENSTFLSNSTDVPAFGQDSSYAPYCARIPWSCSGQAVLESNPIPVSGEALASTVYQMTFWLASDPVVNGIRYRAFGVSGDPMQIDINNTSIYITILGYSADDSLTETLFAGTIDASTGNYLTSEKRWYLKYRTRLFRRSNANTAYFKVKFVCNGGRGLCFDDVVLTAFVYSTDVPINNGSATIPATGSSLYTEDIALYNINTTFVESPSTIDYYDLVLYNENLILNGTFASFGYWTFSSGASLEKRAGYSFFDSSSYSVRLPVTNAEAAQLVNINGMQEYTATAYWRKYDAGSVTIKLKAETFTAAMTSVATYTVTATSTGNADSDWRCITLNFCPASTGVAKVKISVIADSNPSNLSLVADDIQLRQARGYKSFGTTNYWSYGYGSAGLRNFGWTPTIGVPAVGSRYDYTFRAQSTIRWSPSEYNMYFGRWEHPQGMEHTSFYRHYVAPLKRLPNKSFTLMDYVRFWNTTEELKSVPFTIEPNAQYKLHVPLAYPLKPFINPNISQDVQSVSDLFGKPTVLHYSAANMFGYTPDAAASGKALFGWEITDTTSRGGECLVKINNVGYIKTSITFYNSAGQAINTIVPLVIGPSGGVAEGTTYASVDTLATIPSKENPNWKYTESLRSLNFTTPANAVSGVATITFCGTACGLKAFYLFNVSARTSSVTGNLEIDTAFNEGTSRLSFLTDQLRVDGIHVDANDSWHPIIKDGLFERDYIVQPGDSLLLDQGWAINDKLRLIYTVPEFCLEHAFDPRTHQEEVVLADADPIDDHTIFLHNKNIVKILSLIKNGEEILNWPTAIGDLPSLYPEIQAVDSAAGTITFAGQVSAFDEIKVSYTYERTGYVYRGYYDNGKWYDLDLNPSYGHSFHIGVDGCGQPTSTLVNNGVTIYAIPTAAYNSDGDQTGHYIYRSAFSLPMEKRPSYFIRHTLGMNNDAQILKEFPFAIILAKIAIPSPCSLPDIDIIDLRPRGGGLPEDWSNPPLFTEEFRTLVPCGVSGFTYTGIDIAAGEKFEITAFSNVPAASGILLPTNILYGTLTPGSTGFLIGNHYSATAQSSGYLLLQTKNTAATGFIYVRTLVTRKTQRSSRWDTSASWDGEPVMLNGVVIIEVDKRVLTGEDGFRKVTAEEVEEAAKTHVAAGILPIVRYV